MYPENELMKKQAEREVRKQEEKMLEKIAEHYGNGDFGKEITNITDGLGGSSTGDGLGGSSGKRNVFKSKPPIYDPVLLRIIENADIFKGYEIDYVDQNSKPDVKERTGRSDKERYEDFLDKIKKDRETQEFVKEWVKRDEWDVDRDYNDDDYFYGGPEDRYFLEDNTFA